ncbi:MAG TPA: hypothetical protein VFZ91_07695 [Allosphingosinicella sp.]
MGLFSQPSLADLLKRQASRLDTIFGSGTYRIESASEVACTVRTSAVEVEFAYDWRDQWIAPSLRALQVPDEISIPHPVELWMRFNGSDTPLPRKCTLDEQQVIDALELVAEAVRIIFSDPETVRDAAFFAWGYNTAYNDWASRRGSWTEIE